MYGIVFLHIALHRVVKASAFVSSRVVIHGVRTQDGRVWVMDSNRLVILRVFIILIGIGGSTLSISKEELVIGVIRL